MIGHVKFSQFTEQSNITRKFIKIIHSAKRNQIKAFGLSFPNQIGLAAGMDKNGAYPKTFSSLGFGHIEIGTITPQPQTGNAKPRLFRYPKYDALVNRMGFNNDGVEEIVKRIEKIYPKEKRVVPLGINIGKGKKTPIDKAHDDYVSCLRKCYKQADYITINISSPNTPNLRELHQGDLIAPFLQILMETGRDCAKLFNQNTVPLTIKNFS